jgi:hypothetical protein
MLQGIKYSWQDEDTDVTWSLTSYQVGRSVYVGYLENHGL